MLKFLLGRIFQRSTDKDLQCVRYKSIYLYCINKLVRIIFLILIEWLKRRAQGRWFKTDLRIYSVLKSYLQSSRLVIPH